MSTVTHISVAPYTLPLKSPLKWGSGHVMPSLEHVLVRVELSDGAVGIAEINPRPTIYGETPESVEAVIRRHIAPALVGQQIAAPADIARATAQYALLKNNNSARAGVDMALWAALAQSQHTTLPDLLGVTQAAVRVSYILGTGDTDTVLREAADVYRAGVRVLKVKTGKDFEREYALIQQIKTAFPDMDCYIDANETYTCENAAETLSAFAELGVLYCEEPLPVRQLRNRAAVRKSGALPLIGDDSCFTLADLEREIDFGTFDILNIKPPRNGFTEGLTMVETARAAGKGVMMGSQASSILGCIHTLMLAGVEGVAHPSEGTFWLKVDDEAALPVVDGYVSTTDLIEAHTAYTDHIEKTTGFNIDRRIWSLLYGMELSTALGQIVHEMRNSMTGISGGIEIANVILTNSQNGNVIQGFTMENLPEFLAMTGRNVAELGYLIEEILTIQREQPSGHFLSELTAHIPEDHRTAEFLRLIQQDFRQPVAVIGTAANFMDYDLREGNTEALHEFTDVMMQTSDRMAQSLSLYSDVLKKLPAHPAFRYHLTEEDMNGLHHKLGNIVTVLKSYGSLLLNYRERLPAHKIAENLSIIVESTRRIEDTMEKQRLLLQINSGTLGRNEGPLPFDWPEAIEQIARSYRASLDRRNITLQTHIVPALPAIPQSEHLTYMVRELIHNAVQATDIDNAVIRINVSPDGDDRIMLCVEDNGRGIPASEQPHVGERWRGGVGLHIVYRIVVEVYNGNIWFESEENSGTTFFVSLPTG